MKLTEQGHVSLCSAMQTSVFWLAWGVSDSPTLESVLENGNDLALEDEVGRTKETYNGFVSPLPGGAITVGGQDWVTSVTPTKYLYLKFDFPQDANDASDIKQMGLFTDVELEGSETYIDTSEDKLNLMTSIGNLFENRNQATLVRDAATKESYDIIITF